MGLNETTEIPAGTDLAAITDRIREANSIICQKITSIEDLGNRLYGERPPEESIDKAECPPNSKIDELMYVTQEQIELLDKLTDTINRITKLA